MHAAIPRRYVLLRNPPYTFNKNAQKKLTDYGAEIQSLPVANKSSSPPSKSREQYNNLLEFYEIDAVSNTLSELQDDIIRTYEILLNTGIEALRGDVWSARVSLNCARSKLARIQAQGGEFDVHTGEWIDVVEDDDTFPNLQKLYESFRKRVKGAEEI